MISHVHDLLPGYISGKEGLTNVPFGDSILPPHVSIKHKIYNEYLSYSIVIYVFSDLNKIIQHNEISIHTNFCFIRKR